MSAQNVERRWAESGRPGGATPDDVGSRLERIERLLRGEHDPPPQPIRVADLLTAHLSTVRSAKTRADKTSRFVRPLRAWGDRLAHEVTREDVARLRAQLYDEGLSHASVNRHVAYLSAAFRDGIAWGHVRENPVAGIARRREPRRRFPWVPMAEQRRLVGAMPSRPLAASVAVLLATGLRLGEFVALTVSDVRLAGDAEVTVRDSKNGTGRRVPVSRAAREELAELLEAARAAGTPRVSPFVRPSGHLYRSYRFGVAKARLSSVLPGGFHALRHTAAATMVRAGIELPDVARILGISLAMVTDRYADHSPRGYRAMARSKLDRFDRSRRRGKRRGAAG